MIAQLCYPSSNLTHPTSCHLGAQQLLMLCVCSMAWLPLRVHFYAVLAFPVLTTEPECYVPTFVHNTTPGHVAVEVSANGVDYTASDVVFEYQHSITVTQLEPRHGPINGGTEVLVVGTSFANSSLPVRCFCVPRRSHDQQR